MDEYKVSNELLTEDVYVSWQHSIQYYNPAAHMQCQALQSAVQRLEGYVKGLEQEVKSRK